MFLRDGVVTGYLPPLEQAGGYLVYKQGQSAVGCLVERHGEERLRRLLQELRRTRSFDRAFQRVMGIPVRRFDEQWRDELRRAYWPQVATRRDPERFARRLTDHRRDGSALNTAPAVSPQGDRIAWFSDRRQYTDVYVMSAYDGRVLRRVIRGERDTQFEAVPSFRSAIAWSPDGRRLALTAASGGRDVLYVVGAADGRVLRRLAPGLRRARLPGVVAAHGQRGRDRPEGRAGRPLAGGHRDRAVRAADRRRLGREGGVLDAGRPHGDLRLRPGRAGRAAPGARPRRVRTLRPVRPRPGGAPDRRPGRDRRRRARAGLVAGRTQAGVPVGPRRRLGHRAARHRGRQLHPAHRGAGRRVEPVVVAAGRPAGLLRLPPRRLRRVRRAAAGVGGRRAGAAAPRDAAVRAGTGARRGGRRRTAPEAAPRGALAERWLERRGRRPRQPRGPRRPAAIRAAPPGPRRPALRAREPGRWPTSFPVYADTVPVLPTRAPLVERGGPFALPDSVLAQTPSRVPRPPGARLRGRRGAGRDRLRLRGDRAGGVQRPARRPPPLRRPPTCWAARSTRPTRCWSTATCRGAGT